MTTDEIVKALRKNSDENPCLFVCEECDDADCLTPVCRAAADLIEQQAARIAGLEAKVPRWIPVTERFPERDQRALILDKHGNAMVRTLRCLAGEKEPSFRPDGLVPRKHITHWMPMPGWPEEVQHG